MSFEYNKSSRRDNNTWAPVTSFRILAHVFPPLAWHYRFQWRNNLRTVAFIFLLTAFISIHAFAFNDWEVEQLQGNQEFVKLGYGDLREKGYRSLNFVTECLETDQMLQIIPIVAQYNSFDGVEVANALKQFRGKVSCYEFGRAGSPILHIDIPYWTHQREYYNGPKPGERITEAELTELVEEMKKVFMIQHLADEFGKDPIMERKIYFWWD